MEQPYSAIWKSYGLKPKHVETMGRVQKISTDAGQFALKRIPAARGMDFLFNMQKLYQAGYHRFVPVYPALDGRYGILEGSYIYYLMPWIESGRQEAQEAERKMLREAARLHLVSSADVRVSKAGREEQYERTSAVWERQEEQLEQFLLLAEKETYMSSFQLLFCLYYTEIRQAFFYAKEKLSEWKQATEEEEKARTVHVHGKLEPSHFLMDAGGGGYFINLEQSRRATPIHDLIPYFARTLDAFPEGSTSTRELFEYYTSFFPMKKGEKLLFQSYLAYPGAIYETIAAYFLSRQKQNEFQYSRQLQKNYWQMKNIEYFITSLKEEG
ncbi:spore coat protein YsxE [Bacillus aerolatus]|uniref:spore coat protein YsxE n=1 Tax=Bacillus aerolatus TaxID=2653354 RepID=UPI00177D7F8A|nr:spore coat protein YsxE [Bacillus aerolatus]